MKLIFLSILVFIYIVYGRVYNQDGKYKGFSRDCSALLNEQKYELIIQDGIMNSINYRKDSLHIINIPIIALQNDTMLAGELGCFKCEVFSNGLRMHVPLDSSDNCSSVQDCFSTRGNIILIDLQRDEIILTPQNFTSKSSRSNATKGYEVGCLVQLICLFILFFTNF